MMLRTVSAGPTMTLPAIVGRSVEAPITPVMPSSSSVSEITPDASPSALKRSIRPSGGRGVSNSLMRSGSDLARELACRVSSHRFLLYCRGH